MLDFRSIRSPLTFSQPSISGVNCRKSLVKVLLYGYAVGVRNSRKILEEAEQIERGGSRS